MKEYYFSELFIRAVYTIWRKIKRKIYNQLKGFVDWICANLLGTDLSDADLLRALDERFFDLRTFWDYLTIRKNESFFLDLEYHHTIRAVYKVDLETEVYTITVADQVCNHVFDLLGSGTSRLDDQIDWHIDFKTRHRFDPDKYYADVQSASYPGGYDIKVPWELSRCQHFVWLGQAYWFTQDEKYAHEFVAQVLDWIAQNPPQFGVNWVCTMDVAIRSVNWLWGYYFFKESAALNEEFLLAFFKSLLSHGRHILKNLQWSEKFTHNHYLAEIVGLVYLGILIPEFKEAQHWREFGLQELEKEMFKQVYPDGADFEASISYHRLVTELFLSATILAQLNGHAFSAAYMQRLEKMLDFIIAYTKPDGTVPLIGDNDNGRLHRLQVWDPPEREWRDHRYLLAIGAVLFERTDFTQAAGDQWTEAIWLLGPHAVSFKAQVEVKKEIVPESCCFPDAGIYIMRCKDMYMIVAAGPNGQNGKGGHAHNDALSFELFAEGQTWIVDPGTYTYTADHDARNLFRSTGYHNTIVVDGQEQNGFDEQHLFKMQDHAQPRVLVWESIPEYDVFVGEHYGYTMLPEPVVHRRKIYFDKKECFWWIEDVLMTTGKHQYEWNLHLAPSKVIPHSNFQHAFKVKQGEANFLAMFVGDASTTCVCAIKQGWIAPGYGQRVEAPIIRCSIDNVSKDLVVGCLLYPAQSITSDQVSVFKKKAKRRFADVA